MSSKKLVFAEESIDLEFGGNTYKVRFPTSCELVNYTEESKAIDKNDLKAVLEMNHRFLESLGLPKEISARFNSNQTKQVFEALQGN